MPTSALQDLVLHVAVGRLCLSLLPPGWPGYHSWRELGATLAASLLLGSLALALVSNLWIWGALLVVRLALLPGALRPRYEDSRDTGLVAIVGFIAFAAWWTFAHPDLRWTTACLGLVWLVLGIMTWRRRADRRARALACFALLAPVAVVALASRVAP